MNLKISLVGLLCFVFCSQSWAQSNPNYYNVEIKRAKESPKWETFTAKTIDKLPFYKSKKEPALNSYGSWKVNQQNPTGFFRSLKIKDRWWIIDPEGFPFINKGVAVFRPYSSENQEKAMKEKYGTVDKWYKKESDFLKSQGFNGAGAWSDVDLIRKSKKPIVYTVIVNAMASYKAEHIKRFGGKYKTAGWQGYRFDLVMVFDPEFDAYCDAAFKPVAKYKDDKYLLGYYSDNELPWKTDALDISIKNLEKDEPGYIAAKKWLDKRKNKDADLSDITEEDRIAFSGFYFETYMKKVTAALKKYDPNHMYLGCRFNQQERQELTNPEIFKVAGKYMDIISINHYRKWEPDATQMNDWEKWSGKPFLITEWYTKGEDSGLKNNTGAGWLVKTQQDRGYFYQNFVLDLLKSKNCVGWHWFTYQDNDPNNLKVDPSNRDSNKGIVDSDLNRYEPLLKQMKIINDQVFNLTAFFDN
ncbi:hypothetical protein A5893_04855 [Pedobacter psychrophilus]|uniref:Agarase n=2 Tax=Pedobacter psychrophilus TaxID=1826909 RepID=A0A179DGU0_9SPHI|nr:hypothetical protein A5893_04855 [Pedobacter psychrophilus]